MISEELKRAMPKAITSQSQGCFQTPRNYQNELFEIAKKSNVIAVLDTGSGKTLIALLLLQHMALESKQKAARQISIFLVPTVPLVSQQSEYLASNSLLDIGQLHGAQNSGCMDEESWAQSSGKFDVIVMTPAILLNGMDRGFVKMEQINLLVFDECHHTKANHPYNLLMQLHYESCPIEKRPKIFGMTASPCAKKDDSRIAVEQLEKKLNATAVSIYEGASLKKFVSRPKERIVYYETGSTFFHPPKLYLHIAERYPRLMSLVEKEMGDALKFCDLLGPWAAERAIELSIAELGFLLAKKIQKIANDAKFDTVDFIQKTVEEMPKDFMPNPSTVLGQDYCDGFYEDSNLVEAIKEYDDAPKRFKVDFSDGSKITLLPTDETEADCPKELKLESNDEYHGMVFRMTKSYDQFSKYRLEDLNYFLNACNELARLPYWGSRAPPPTFEEIGPKVQCLVDILLEYETTDSAFCGIVFCQQRIMARVLEVTIRSHPELKFIKSGCLLGHGRSSKSSGMSSKSQELIVENFRNGTINLIIATQVAEEGLDIRPCNCVIRFNMKDMTLINYIQSRGRARHETSQFIIMSEKGDDAVAHLLRALRSSEGILKETLSVEPAQAEFETVIGPEQIFRIPSTGATASIYNAISIINNYCMKLPADRYYLPKAEYLVASGPNGYAAEVRMPKSVRVECSKLRGPICPNIVLAKREAAFGMLKLLHTFGEVDDHFRPHSMYTIDQKSKLVENNVQTKRLSRKKMVRNHKTKIPTAFTGEFVAGANVFVNLLQFDHNVDEIELKGILPIAFLSFGRINPLSFAEFEVFITGKRTSLSIFPTDSTLVLAENDISMFRKYHYEFFKSVLRSNFDEEQSWATLCIPIIPELASVGVNPRTFLDTNAIKCMEGNSATLESILNGQYPCSTGEAVAYDEYHYKRHYFLSGLQKEVTPVTLPYANHETVADFYKYRLECPEDIKPDQPIIHGVPVGYPYHSSKKVVFLKECPLIPQFIKISPILKKHIKCALLMPILLRSVTHRLLMMDIIQGSAFPDSIGRFNVSPDLLSQAFTTPSANVHLNYDRIEFLGDAFLKLQLGLHLFVMNPGRHEGYLSVARISLENNNYLRGNANAIQLEEFILSTSFSRKLWIPPTHNAKELQSISDKTVADVVEATIGASYLYGGIESAADVVSYFISSENFYRNWDLYREKWSSYVVPTPLLDQSTLETCVVVSSRIGYTFKNVFLLAEALTHSSAVSGASSLERLEYLGDAILGFAISEKIYSLEENLNPGGLSVLRSELVGNQFLAVVSVALGLPDCINHSSKDLGTAMSNWSTELVSKFDEYSWCLDPNSDRIPEAEAFLYWNRLSSAPKTMGDVVESVLGAVFVDSQFSYEAVLQVLDKIMFQPWWDRFKGVITPEGVAIQHPASELSAFIDTSYCTQIISNTVHTQGLYTVTYLRHDKDIGSGTAETKREARKIAASNALSHIKSLTDTECECRQEAGIIDNLAELEDEIGD